MTKKEEGIVFPPHEKRAKKSCIGDLEILYPSTSTRMYHVVSDDERLTRLNSTRADLVYPANAALRPLTTVPPE